MAQSFGEPALIALSHTMQKYKRNYYDALEHMIVMIKNKFYLNAYGFPYKP